MWFRSCEHHFQGREGICAGANPVLALVLALVAGCAAPPTGPVVPPGPAVVAVPAAPAGNPLCVDPWARFLVRADPLLRLAPAELAPEIARLSQANDIFMAYENTAANEARQAAAETALLLATALAQTGQPVDTARALALVQRVLDNDATPVQAWHPLARLLHARLLQQRHLEEQLERQAQQLRDIQRRNEQLNERLEAMRAIERSLTTRPLPPAINGVTPSRPAP